MGVCKECLHYSDQPRRTNFVGGVQGESPKSETQIPIKVQNSCNCPVSSAGQNGVTHATNISISNSTRRAWGKSRRCHCQVQGCGNHHIEGSRVRTQSSVQQKFIQWVYSQAQVLDKIHLMGIYAERVSTERYNAEFTHTSLHLPFVVFIQKLVHEFACDGVFIQIRCTNVSQMCI